MTDWTWCPGGTNLPQLALIRRPVCPKCGCKKFRNVGSFGHYVDEGKTFRPVAVYIECMRCEELWDRAVSPATLGKGSRKVVET